MTWAAWQGLGYDAHSLLGDPHFISSSNLHVSAGSPAINAGINEPTDLTKDIDGQLRSDHYDIGADEQVVARKLPAKGAKVSLANPGFKSR